MKPAQVAKTISRGAFDTFEALGKTLGSQVAKPIGEEAFHEFFGTPQSSRNRAQILAQEDLARARQEKKLEEEKAEDNKKSQQKINYLLNEYRIYDQKTAKEQQPLQEEMGELQAEVVKLAKAAGVETKAHLQNPGKKIGALDIKILTTIVRFLRIKAEEGKNAKELVMQRSNAKRPTGMLAWVSGKQMKVHEQGTLQLQG